MRCLIIEDEPVARDILRQYISDTPLLQLAGECENALEALEVLKKESIDLIFLDINMPKLSGISFLKSLNHPPKVILTTAYSEYALEGYELSVIDYLLKPYSFERFLKAIHKAEQKTELHTPSDTDLIIRADGKTYRIGASEVLYVEALGDYITLHTADKKLTFNQSLKGILSDLPGAEFIRVHKSFLVNLKAIDFVEGNLIRILDADIPIGKAYKDAFKERFNGNT